MQTLQYIYKINSLKIVSFVEYLSWQNHCFGHLWFKGLCQALPFLQMSNWNGKCAIIHKHITIIMFDFMNAVLFAWILQSILIEKKHLNSHYTALHAHFSSEEFRIDACSSPCVSHHIHQYHSMSSSKVVGCYCTKLQVYMYRMS